MDEQIIIMKKNLLLGIITDSISDIFYYDRKNDDELSVEDVDYLTDNACVTRQELLKAFNDGLDVIFERESEE